MHTQFCSGNLKGKHQRGWEDNIKMGLREMGCGCVDWIHLAEDRGQWRALVSTVMNQWVA
jgi:hypothetical protein